MSEFFVRRPIVAIVIAILMTLIGGVCILALPIAQYPQIAPPEIQVQAQSQLPPDVNNYGVTVKKSTTAPLMLISLYSPKGTYDNVFLANYGYINLFDQLTRLPGIGNVQVFGAGQYAMRLWVKPVQLAKLGITVPDIISAVQKQNTVNPAGQIGSEPIPSGQKFTYTVRAQGRLQTPEEFRSEERRVGKE